jgi:hypothetical protein
VITGQSGKPVQNWDSTGFGLWWYKDRKSHFSAAAFGRMTEHFCPSAKTFARAELLNFKV